MDRFFVEKAFIELREDETRKVQSLSLLREWIAKHPFLSEIRQDDIFLLQLLRVRKYNMIDVFKNFESIFISKRRYKEFFDFNENNFEKMMKLYKDGYCYPLSERGSEGQKIVMILIRNWNTETFSSMDTIRLVIYIYCVLLEEEETQVCGISSVYDFGGVTMSQVTSYLQTKDFMSFFKDSQSIFAARQKKIYVLNLPSFAVFFVELMTKLLKEKLQKRVLVLKKDDNFKNHTDILTLPEEYGGLKTQAEMMRDFLIFEEKKRVKVLESLNFKIDLSKVPGFQEEAEGVGSFRKLEID